MATTKKKPSPAQIAARKLFAERAKAGTLGKATAKRKTNPSTVAKSGKYVVYMGTPGKVIALDLSKTSAIKIAKHKNSMMKIHTTVERGDTGEVVYDSAPWFKAPAARMKNPRGRKARIETMTHRAKSAGAAVKKLYIAESSKDGKNWSFLQAYYKRDTAEADVRYTAEAYPELHFRVIDHTVKNA